MNSLKLELHEVQNPDCKKCNRAGRDERVEEGLCADVVSVVDRLPVRCVGDWAYAKIYRLVKYLGIFAGGMKNKWPGLNYVEICSGPGRCIRKSDGMEMDGTALAVIRHPIFTHIQRAVFIDLNAGVVEALNRRFELQGVRDKAEAMIGDYSDTTTIEKLMAALPRNNLNLCFLDPTECDVPFATMEAIVRAVGKVDFIINVALGTDVGRNIANACLEPAFQRTRAKYEAFLGLPGFCQRPAVQDLARIGNHEELRQAFLAAYLTSFQRLHYLYSDARPVKHFYHLLFLSRHERGLEFWNKACKIAPDNQRELF
jgi:three-Cys-motif partner protein